MAGKSLFGALASALLLAGCTGGSGLGGGIGISPYRLMDPKEHDVARTLLVTPTIRWNRAPRTVHDIGREENWTLNGPMLDSLTFVGGLESGDPLVRWQRRRDIRQVPEFRADMTPPEIASMIESFYRIRSGSVRFEMTGLQPRTFLGQPGFQFDYFHLGGDELERQGRVVGTVIGNRLYMILFDAARMHYFPAAIDEVERIVESARLRSSR